jgi:hypothetical protein
MRESTGQLGSLAVQVDTPVQQKAHFHGLFERLILVGARGFEPAHLDGVAPRARSESPGLLASPMRANLP